MMPPLSLPPASLRFRPGASGRTLVYDEQRRRFVTLTAEEWVRQHFVHYLIHTLGYPPALIANEVTVEISGVARRCDTVIYSPLDGHPLVIVEYKAPSVAITQEVFAQIQTYNAALRAEYLIVSNGKRHFCCFNNYEQMTVTFLQEMPEWAEINPKK